jgi:hypothetical protein
VQHSGLSSKPTTPPPPSDSSPLLSCSSPPKSNPLNLELPSPDPDQSNPHPESVLARTLTRACARARGSEPRIRPGAPRKRSRSWDRSIVAGSPARANAGSGRAGRRVLLPPRAAAVMASLNPAGRRGPRRRCSLDPRPRRSEQQEPPRPAAGSEDADPALAEHEEHHHLQ